MRTLASYNFDLLLDVTHMDKQAPRGAWTEGPAGLKVGGSGKGRIYILTIILDAGPFHDQHTDFHMTPRQERWLLTCMIPAQANVCK